MSLVHPGCGWYRLFPESTVDFRLVRIPRLPPAELEERQFESMQRVMQQNPFLADLEDYRRGLWEQFMADHTGTVAGGVVTRLPDAPEILWAAMCVAVGWAFSPHPPGQREMRHPKRRTALWRIAPLFPHRLDDRRTVVLSADAERPPHNAATLESWERARASYPELNSQHSDHWMQFHEYLGNAVAVRWDENILANDFWPELVAKECAKKFGWESGEHCPEADTWRN